MAVGSHFLLMLFDDCRHYLFCQLNHGNQSLQIFSITLLRPICQLLLGRRGCSKPCSTSGYLVKKIISFQKMQIVSYLPSALSAETNIIFIDSIRPRSRTNVLPTPSCPRAISTQELRTTAIVWSALAKNASM